MIAAIAAVAANGMLGREQWLPWDIPEELAYFEHTVAGAALVMGIADGPTEVHKVTVAKQVLKDYRPDNDLFPSYHIPRLQDEAKAKYAKELEELKEGYARLKAEREKATA